LAQNKQLTTEQWKKKRDVCYQGGGGKGRHTNTAFLGWLTVHNPETRSSRFKKKNPPLTRKENPQGGGVCPKDKCKPLCGLTRTGKEQKPKMAKQWKRKSHTKKVGGRKGEKRCGPFPGQNN